MRLIDADALDMAFTQARFNPDGSLRHWGDRKDWCMHGQEVEDLIALQPTVGGWISVNDGLPDLRHAVLGYAPSHKNIWAVVMHEDGNWYFWSPDASRPYVVTWNGPITHWMPLPEPPKEGEQ